MTICDECVDEGIAKTIGLRDKASSAPLKSKMRSALESVKSPGPVPAEVEHRRDPLYVCKDIFDVRP